MSSKVRHTENCRASEACFQTEPRGSCVGSLTTSSAADVASSVGHEEERRVRDWHGV